MPSVYDALLGDSLVHNDPKVTYLLRQCNDPELIQAVLAKRAKYRTWVTIKQREWQTKVSKRPQRGRHHDSHPIRERYVRC